MIRTCKRNLITYSRLVGVCICFMFCMPSHAQESYVVVKAINYNGIKVTKKEILDRELKIKIGDTINTSYLNDVRQENIRQLQNLKIFSEVKDSITYLNPNEITLAYYVTEISFWLVQPSASLADRNFNVWFFENNAKLNRVNIGNYTERLNVRGRNESVGLGIELGYNRTIYAKYYKPNIGKSMKHGIAINASYLESKEINYTTDRNKFLFYKNIDYTPFRKAELTLSYFYRPKYNSIHQAQLSWYHIGVSNELNNVNPAFINGKRKIDYLQLAYKYTYNKLNYVMYPTKGINIIINPSVKWLAINQLTFYANADLYFPINQKWSTAFNTRVRLTTWKNINYYNNRALGIKNDFVRGYEYYVIDGSHFGLVRANLRYLVFSYLSSTNKIKYFRNKPIKGILKTYSDMGYVKANSIDNSFLNNKLLYSAGVGLDIIVSYFVKIRIEYSMNNLSEKGLFLHGNKE